MIVDDTDWTDVDRAMDDYLAEQPRARRILTLDGKDRGSPQWWEGMQVLVWRLRRGPAPGPTLDSLLRCRRASARRVSTVPLLSFRSNVATYVSPSRRPPGSAAAR